MEAPRRNIRNEIIIALGALLTLALAVGLAVLLTADSLQELLATSTGTPQATIQSNAATAEPSVTRPPATLPPGPTATRQSTSTASPTVVPASATPSSPGPGPTSTSQESAIVTETSTRIPPTVSPTTTPTRTRTPVPPTATATKPPTPTVPPSPTNTPTPSATATLTATATIQPATPITYTPTSSTGACSPPADWRPYTVRSGDNLFRLSLRAGVPLAQMQSSNCIVNAASIETGQIIYVPAAFFANTPSSPGTTGGGTTSTIPRQAGCTNVGSRITSPAPGAVASSPFTVSGIATLDEDSQLFAFYKVELRREDQSVYRNVRQSQQPVTRGALATIDPALFGPGTYELVLTVVDITGNYIEPCAIRVTFR